MYKWEYKVEFDGYRHYEVILYSTDLSDPTEARDATILHKALTEQLAQEVADMLTAAYAAGREHQHIEDSIN